MLKSSIIIGTFLALIYLLVTLLLKADKDLEIQDNRLVGSFRMTDSPNVILNLLPRHVFTLENHISEKYYGDGNWKTRINEVTSLTLDFENGETLILTYFPQDSSLVSETLRNHTVKLRRTASND